MTPRKAITGEMKWKACLYRAQVPCAECDILLFPDDDIEWDHVHALVHDGPHEYQNIRPMHASCHANKTIRDVKANAKVKRLRGETKKRPKRKIASRPFPKRRAA